MFWKDPGRFSKKKSHNFRMEKYFSKRFFYLDARTQKLQNSGSVLSFDSVFKIFKKKDGFFFDFS